MGWDLQSIQWWFVLVTSGKLATNFIPLFKCRSLFWAVLFLTSPLCLEFSLIIYFMQNKPLWISLDKYCSMFTWEWNMDVAFSHCILFNIVSHITSEISLGKKVVDVSLHYDGVPIQQAANTRLELLRSTMDNVCTHKKVPNVPVSHEWSLTRAKCWGSWRSKKQAGR